MHYRRFLLCFIGVHCGLAVAAERSVATLAGDTVIRATYHHNYFHDVGSRLPSIRFGKAHVFNNYYVNVPDGSGVNSRMGAVVRVEGNHFQGVENPICFLDSAKTGYWDIGAGNMFESCTGSQPTTSTRRR